MLKNQKLSLLLGTTVLVAQLSLPVLAQDASVEPAKGDLLGSLNVGTQSGAMPPSNNDVAPQSAPKSLSGIGLPTPPPPAAFNSNNAQLTQQAEQAAQQAEVQADADRQRRDEERNKKAYERASGGLLPLSPEQIRDFMHRLEMSQEAGRQPSYGVPKGEARITTLSLDPGTPPPQVNLQSGFVTTINIMDATGEPWPILDVGVGGNFEVTPTRAGLHVIRVMPLSAVADGNLSVQLKDLSTPVIFRLTAGGHQVDMRYDARIPKMGPGAKPQIISRPRLEAGNETIMMLLQNAPPKSATKLKIAGLDARSAAWSLDDRTYVRTPLTLLSPAWDSSVSSDDGMTVYEIGDAPVLLMSDNGALIRARLMRDEDHDR